LALSAATRWPRPVVRQRAVYTELAELGLAGLAVPEAHGGLGQGAIEAMVVCEELGRGLVNAPYTAAALMAPCC
jgi:alkylation response protein AidB-like acyl-CoA dehydrogenase